MRAPANHVVNRRCARVALIDADPSSRAAFATLLADHQLSPLPYPTAQSFLREHARVSDQSSLPAVLLISLESDQDLSVLTSLLEWERKVVTIVYSTSGDVGAAVRCFRAGATDFIDHAKPDASFAQRVRGALDPSPESCSATKPTSAPISCFSA